MIHCLLTVLLTAVVYCAACWLGIGAASPGRVAAAGAGGYGLREVQEDVRFVVSLALGGCLPLAAMMEKRPVRNSPDIWALVAYFL